MRNAALTHKYVPDVVQVAKVQLGEFQAAHQDLLEQMSIMDAITNEPRYDPGTLATARWKISQASLARRMLAGRICDYLLPRCGPDQMLALKSFQEADCALLRESARHVGHWRAEMIAQDWRGYCRASREIRDRMHTHIALEQRVLYGILERAIRLGD